MPQPSEADILEEQRHFENVVSTFEQYGPYALAANNRRRRDFYSLPLEDQRLLEEIGWKDRLVDIDKAILENAKFIKQIIAEPKIFSDAELAGDGDSQEENVAKNPGIVESAVDMQTDEYLHEHGYSHSHSHSTMGHGHTHTCGSSQTHAHHQSGSQKTRYRPTDFDMDKLRSTIKQFVRDWSEEGKAERDVCYEPMKEALVNYYSGVPKSERAKLRVLVPGAGLGRLAYDVARLGFSSQGNEFSHYMLLSSFLILNRTEREHQYTIYPHVHSLSNVPNREAFLRPISIPDTLPSAIPPGVSFSLVAGDFEEVYGADDTAADEPQAGQWDAILTCFFIDTAKHFINYLRIIHRILAPGGVWVNLGPLLWHWENNTSNDPSIELDLEEVKILCSKIGFKLENERTIEATYTHNAQSLLGYVYKAAFWTATKVEKPSNP